MITWLRAHSVKKRLCAMSRQQSADQELLRRVRKSRDSLAVIYAKAESALEAMKKDFEARIKEQERIVADAERMRNSYNRQSTRWEQGNPSLPLGSTYQVEKKMFKYSRNMGSMLEVPYPWLATPPPPPAPAQDSESEKEDLFGDPPPPSAARPKRKVGTLRVVVDSSEDDDEVVVTGERSRQERDAALRKKAVPLDSCVVDEVFRKLRVKKWTP